MLPISSRSLLATWTSGLTQDTSRDVIPAGNCVYHTMGGSPAGSEDMAAALGCRWGVQGTYMGTGSTDPTQIYSGASLYPSIIV